MKPPGWKIIFWGLTAVYCLYYAPYGINETDGGFITGLAWQVLNGKMLYADVVYVRPPLTVWLRALELKLLPESWAILGERYIFYGKLALYSYLGASILERGVRHWILAVLSFVVSAHCYPPAAWHTVDGILFGVLSLWCLTNGRTFAGPVLCGIFMAACLLSKQSFYPMAVVWSVFVWVQARRGAGGGDVVKRAPVSGFSSHLAYISAFSAFTLSLAIFFFYLYQSSAFADYWQLTNGATSGGQAVQHGLLDYFRIQPVLALSSILLLTPVVRCLRYGKGANIAFAAWVVFLLALGLSYGWTICRREEFTAPFAQTRLLFWVALFWGMYRFWRKTWNLAETARFYALLGLCWCASVSWGYNLPVLFALPWVYAAFDLSEALFSKVFPRQSRTAWWPAVVLTGLLALFRLGYEYVYRDGPRNQMSVHMGDIFPRLQGIYSTAETAGLYTELREIAMQYGPDIKTLPSFPQASYLTRGRPPLPLDWVVEREMQAGKAKVVQTLKTGKTVLLIEKTYGARLNTDPELVFTMKCLIEGRIVKETRHFWVVIPGREQQRDGIK